MWMASTNWVVNPRHALLRSSNNPLQDVVGQTRDRYGEGFFKVILLLEVLPYLHLPFASVLEPPFVLFPEQKVGRPFLERSTSEKME